MKNFILAVVVILSFSSCGSSVKKTVDQEKSNDQQKKVEQKVLLSEDNYINITKFQYQRELSKLQRVGNTQNNNDKFRSYPGARNSKNGIKNAIKIETVTPFNRYIESMKLSYKTKRVDLKIKNKLYAEISLYENGSLVKSEKLTMNDFTKFDLPQMKGVR
jgi:hypothetical protein